MQKFSCRRSHRTRLIRVLSVASAGDNTLALVGAGARRVIAVDLNPAQIACLELRVAAYRHLSHSEFLLLMGQHRCRYRMALYQRCRASLSDDSRHFWDAHPRLVQRGVAQVGKFEGYLDKFRRFRSAAGPAPEIA